MHNHNFRYLRIEVVPWRQSFPGYEARELRLTVARSGYPEVTHAQVLSDDDFKGAFHYALEYAIRALYEQLGIDAYSALKAGK